MASLWVVLLLTFVASLGTGGITNGISFLTESALRWQPRENFAMLIVLGATYAIAAAAAGRVVAWLRSVTGLSSRGVLMSALGTVGLAALLPPTWAWVAGQPAAWTIWVFAIVFAPATGMLWPIVESYLSGGRRTGRLRTAVGRFNITWAVAVAAAFWLMAPLVKPRPLEVIAGLGVLHLASMGLAWWLPREPAAHLHDAHADDGEPHDPEREARLLHAFRGLLPITYLLLSLLGPLLPPLTGRLDIAEGWRTPVASAWLISRLFVFVTFERWHGWHGRWWPIWVFSALVGLGFASVLLTGMATEQVGVTPGRVAFVGGLAAFGVGIAGIYLGALYYAMASAPAAVEAGGRHESLIGIGYTVGPLGGLGALLLFAPEHQAVGLGLMAVIGCVGLLGVHRATSKPRRGLV